MSWLCGAKADYKLQFGLSPKVRRVALRANASV